MPEDRELARRGIEAMHAGMPGPDPQYPRRVLSDGFYFDRALDAGSVNPKSVRCRIERAQIIASPGPQGSEMIDEESPHLIVTTARRIRRIAAVQYRLLLGPVEM